MQAKPKAERDKKGKMKKYHVGNLIMIVDDWLMKQKNSQIYSPLERAISSCQLWKRSTMAHTSQLYWMGAWFIITLMDQT